MMLIINEKKIMEQSGSPIKDKASRMRLIFPFILSNV